MFFYGPVNCGIQDADAWFCTPILKRGGVGLVWLVQEDFGLIIHKAKCHQHLRTIKLLVFSFRGDTAYSKLTADSNMNTSTSYTRVETKAVGQLQDAEQHMREQDTLKQGSCMRPRREFQVGKV